MTGAWPPAAGGRRFTCHPAPRPHTRAAAKEFDFLRCVHFGFGQISAVIGSSRRALLRRAPRRGAVFQRRDEA